MMSEWVKILSRREVWTEALATFVILLACWVASRIYVYIVDHIWHRWARRTESTLDDEILAVVRRPGAIAVILVGVYAAVHRYQFKLRDLVDGVLFILAVLVIVTALFRVARVLLIWYGDRSGAGRDGDAVRRELIPLAEKIVRIVFYTMGLLIVLEHFHIPIQSILVSLGVGSLAVGLALQDTLANVFGGFTILLDRPFRVGDRIQLQSGETGDVQTIGMRSTSVLMPDGNMLLIPNALLVKTMVINHSEPGPHARVAVEIRVGLDAPLEKVKRILVEAARGDRRVLASPEPAVVVTGVVDSTIGLRLVCFSSHFIEAGLVADSIYTAVLKQFGEEGIRVPSPVRTVVIEGKDPRQV